MFYVGLPRFAMCVGVAIGIVISVGMCVCVSIVGAFKKTPLYRKNSMLCGMYIRTISVTYQIIMCIMASTG